MKLEAGKEYKTRDGRNARVYAVDGTVPYVIHGAVKKSDGEWMAAVWRENGHVGSEVSHDPSDIMPPANEFWVMNGIVFQTKEDVEWLLAKNPDLHADRIFKAIEVEDDA